MEISRSALLPYASEQMYQIVADIESYPKFLNWCKATQIIAESEQEVTAKLEISYSLLNIDFATRNKNKYGKSIDISLVDGPFNFLSGQWLFRSLGEDGSKVSINMQFDFENTLTKKMMAKVFASVINAQFDAFMLRAKQVYGQGNA